MAVPELKLASEPVEGMDRKIHRKRWAPSRWPLGTRLGIAAAALIAAALLAVKLVAGTGVRTLRMQLGQVTVSTVEQGIFHDLIPLRASVVPRETVYIDAVDGGRVDRVLVEAGDWVHEGQAMIVLSNTNLALQVIQQESQLNQAISQLEQNEISLEQNQLANDRALAEIDYNVVRLGRSAERRTGLAAKGLASGEERDAVADELAYYQRLRPIQAESGQRQSDLRTRLLPDIHQQLKNLRENLGIVHDKLDSLVIRAPIDGKVTAIDLKVGETRSPGQRLAEVTPERGMKLTAAVDEFYLARVRVGQSATITLEEGPVRATVRKVFPQVRDGQFQIDLDFDSQSPEGLVEGATAQGHLQLGGDSPAMILPAGAFLQETGGSWVFVVAPDGASAERRRIVAGRRTSEQLEVMGGLAVGERVITSDYTGLDPFDRIILAH
jgi:HlyD family secretion protein